MAHLRDPRMMRDINEAPVKVPKEVRETALLRIHEEKGRRPAVGAHALIPPSCSKTKDPANAFIPSWWCKMGAKEAGAGSPK